MSVWIVRVVVKYNCIANCLYCTIIRLHRYMCFRFTPVFVLSYDKRKHDIEKINLNFKISFVNIFTYILCYQCTKAYVEFEIGQGAYEISCPDDMCKSSQGIISLREIENLVTPETYQRHLRFRKNKGSLLGC